MVSQALLPARASARKSLNHAARGGDVATLTMRNSMTYTGYMPLPKSIASPLNGSAQFSNDCI